jgi:hypothetical protein
MGKSAPTDPTMAAMLAARAAAEAAAAAAAAAADDEPTLASSTTRRLMEDGTFAAAGSSQLDATTVADLMPADAQDVAADATASNDRDSLLGLPDLGSMGSFGDRTSFADLGGGPAADLTASLASHSSPTMGKGMISDGPLSDAVGSTPFYNQDAGTSDAGSGDGGTAPLIGDYGGEGWGGHAKATRYRYTEDGVIEEKPGSTTPAGTGDTTTPKAVHSNPDQIEGGGVPWYTALYEAIFGSEKTTAGGDGGADGGTDGGSDGGTPSAEYKVPDEDGTGGWTPPPGWVDPSTLVGGTLGQVLTGVTGRDPAAGDSNDPLGPQGGDTTVNPGTEGYTHSAERQEYLGGATAYGGGVKDPPKEMDAPVAIDPDELEVQMGPGDEVVDPTDPNSAANASTAYQADEDPIGGHGHGRSDEHGLGQGAIHGHGPDDSGLDPADDLS